MKINGKLNNFDLFLLQEAFNGGHNIEAKCGASRLIGTETVKVHSEGWGNWYMFGGHCMRWGLIQANTWEEAFEIYVEMFVASDEQPEDDSSVEYGYWCENGKWVSESTMSYIVSLGHSDYDGWDITITENK